MKIKVIKIGGKLIESSEVLARLCDGLASLGEPFVLVHGGGVLGSQLATKLGVEVKMHASSTHARNASLKPQSSINCCTHFFSIIPLSSISSTGSIISPFVGSP